MKAADKKSNSILGKIRHFPKKKYDAVSRFLIPILLTLVLEFDRKFFSSVLNAKTTAGDTLNDQFKWATPVCIILGVVCFFILFFLIIKLSDYITSKIYDSPNEEEKMKDSFLRLKEFGFQRQKLLANVEQNAGNSLKYAESSIKMHMESIHLAVTTCWGFFVDSFSDRRNLVSDIIFEVSFMSKSYKDNYLTVVSCDNNKHRKPPSMKQRQSNPQIYDATETKELYNLYENDPSKALGIHIVPNCLGKDFNPLYDTQTETIKSLAVLPVLSPQNDLLGTLVVCVNQVDFFEIKDSHFWNELLEIFSVELGYHYLALDYCIKNNNNSLPDEYKVPF